MVIVEVFQRTSALQLVESGRGCVSYCDLILSEPHGEKGMWTTKVPGYWFKFITQNDARMYCITKFPTTLLSGHCFPKKIDYSHSWKTTG